MKKNLGSLDKNIRLALAAVAILLVVTETLTGTWATIGIVAAVTLILTSTISFCPLYLPFGIRTNRNAPKAN